MKNSILNTVRSYKFAIATFTALLLAAGTSAQAQTSYTGTTSTGLWFSSRWNNTTDVSPYTSAFTANNAASFAAGNYTFTGGGTGSVGNVTLASGATVTFSGTSGTWGTGGAVRTLDIGVGSVLNLGSQPISTAAGTGFIKTGAGVLATAGGGYSGGFTLNAGTVIMRGVDAMGGSASNVLTLNGGTVASNDNRAMTTAKYGGGIILGGNVQFGELSTNVALADSSATLSFANNVSLGGSVRTLILGNNGVQTFSGIISNSSGGITFSANSGLTGTGRFDITGTANTFTGPININAGEARFTADGSFGNSANTIVIDGGRLATADAATYTITAGRGIAVGDGAGTSISTTTSGTLTYNGVIANKSGEIGSWAKQGAGTLVLGGVSTYTGNTAIEAGLLQLTGGNDRLPTGTVVSLGSIGTTLGTLDLNGQNQRIAGLVSTTGTVASGSVKNTVTSTAAATLEINVAEGTTKSYGAGTTQNSGVITGLLGLTKSGLGTQVLGDANTYSGTTTVNAGTLAVNGSITSSSAVVNGGLLNVNGTAAAVTVNSGGSLGGSGTVGAVTLANGSFLKPGNSPGLLTAASSSWAAGSTYQWEIDNATGKAGTNWDLFSVTGALDMSALSSGSKMNLVLESLSVANYSTATSFSWVIAQAGSFTGTGLADGTNVTDLFNINATAFNGGNLPTNGFKVEVGTSGSLRTLNLMAIPEPSTGALLGFGLGGLVITRLLRRKQS